MGQDIMKVNLKKLIGEMPPEPVKRDVQISVRYETGRCHLDAWITKDGDYFVTACKTALDLIEMGFSVTEVSIRGVKADKNMTIWEFSDLYQEAARLRG